MNTNTLNYSKTELIQDVETAFELSLNLGDSIWFAIDDERFRSFEEKKEAFFILLKECLRQGVLKLQRNMNIIEHEPEEWEKIFRDVFPEVEIEYSEIAGYAPFDIYMWFITDECPAYAVWVYQSEDGSEYLEWT